MKTDWLFGMHVIEPPPFFFCNHRSLYGEEVITIRTGRRSWLRVALMGEIPTVSITRTGHEL